MPLPDGPLSLAVITGPHSLWARSGIFLPEHRRLRSVLQWKWSRNGRTATLVTRPILAPLPAQPSDEPTEDAPLLLRRNFIWLVEGEHVITKLANIEHTFAFAFVRQFAEGGMPNGRVTSTRLSERVVVVDGLFGEFD